MGEFEQRRGEFYDQETFDDRADDTRIGTTTKAQESE